MTELILFDETDPEEEIVFVIPIRDDKAADQIAVGLRDAGQCVFRRKMPTVH